MKVRVYKIITKSVHAPSDDYYRAGESQTTDIEVLDYINEFDSYDEAALYLNNLKEEYLSFDRNNYRKGTYTILPIFEI